MTTHLPRLLLCFAILASAATASGQTLELRPIELRPNLLPDGSFETASGEPTPPWQWHQGKTDAVGRIDSSESHTGKQSLRVSNSTPFAAHVYGMLALSGDVAVKPNTTYTFSCYVKGPRIGIAWFGGGKDWRIRATAAGADRRRLDASGDAVHHRRGGIADPRDPGHGEPDRSVLGRRPATGRRGRADAGVRPEPSPARRRWKSRYRPVRRPDAATGRLSARGTRSTIRATGTCLPRAISRPRGTCTCPAIWPRARWRFA